jgi:hypothetical protein
MPVVTVKTRIWSLAAVAWTAFYGVLYILIVRRDGNPVAWWYVTLIGAGALLMLAGAVEGATHRGRTALLAALVVLVVSGLLGIATIGFLLVPSVVATGIAIGATNREPRATAR